jgi:hypothetical protein
LPNKEVADTGGGITVTGKPVVTKAKGIAGFRSGRPAISCMVAVAMQMYVKFSITFTVAARVRDTGDSSWYAWWPRQPSASKADYFLKSVWAGRATRISASPQRPRPMKSKVSHRLPFSVQELKAQDGKQALLQRELKRDKLCRQFCKTRWGNHNGFQAYRR